MKKGKEERIEQRNGSRMGGKIENQDIKRVIAKNRSIDWMENVEEGGDTGWG